MGTERAAPPVQTSWRTAFHQSVDRLDRRLGPTLRANPVAERLWVGILDAAVARQSDRAYLQKVILPALVRVAPQRVLSVGVRGYTRTVEKAFDAARTAFWTVDIDPAAAVHGAPGRHVTVDVRRLGTAFPPAYFDVVLLNGVFGWGVDEPEQMNQALHAVASVLVDEGMLLVGWNTDRAPDPDTLPGIVEFARAAPFGLPERQSFVDVTHVYAWYTKRR